MYEVRPAHPALRRFIEHYWRVAPTEGAPVDLRVEVFVDARADLVFNYGAPYTRQVIGGATRTLRASNLDAQRTVPIRIVQRGQVRISGVRFHLGGLGPFSRGPLRPFTDDTPPPEAVLGDDAVALESALREAPGIDAEVALLDAFFLARLSLSDGFTAFEAALSTLVASNGAAPLAALATAAGASTRQVERLFARHLGIAPRTASRVVRFQSALRALMRDPGVPLADVAAAAGYFDQAHFIKDFRRLSGGVPRGYRGYYPPAAPTDFAPNVVVFLQDA